MVLGIDIGGTFIKVVGKDENDNIFKEKISVNFQDKKTFVNEILKIVEKHRPSKVGIAIAGLVDKKSGQLTNSPNLKFLEGLNLKQEIENQSNIKVFIENDANLAAYGEYVYGNGKDSKILVCLTLGTGLGGGAVIGGKILSGVSGSAMEIGHIVVEKNGLPCHCGRNGCLEAYVSSYGLERIYCMLTEKKTTSFEIVNLAKNKDEKALKSFEMFSDYLSTGIMNIAHIFNPDKILLAGGIIEHYPDILEIVREKAKNLIFPLPLRDLKIDMAKLGSWSGAFGALAFAEGHSS